MKTKLKKTLQIALVVCLAFTSVAGSAFAMHKHFADAQGHWAEDIINQLANKGIVAGYPDGLVRPDNIITRSEFSVLVARTMELTASAEEVLDIEFTDIKDHWAEKDIEALVAEDIIEEQDYSTEFFPNDPITRYECGNDTICVEQWCLFPYSQPLGYRYHARCRNDTHICNVL